MALSANFLPSSQETFRSSFSHLDSSSRPAQVPEKSVDNRMRSLPLMVSYDSLFSSSLLRTPKRRAGWRYQIRNAGDQNGSRKRMANLCVQRRQKVPLPTHVDKTGRPKPLRDFLCQPAGMESMLNTNSLQSHEHLGHNIFRCTLPKLEILNFAVAPVIDLCVVTNEHECIVEMLSCKFQGSEAVERQNERFSASMRNQLVWDRSSETNSLEANVELNVSLEVYTLPFTLLPLSAVETPGNVILQAMVDRMVPIFIEHLLNDYQRWAQLDDNPLDVKETPADYQQEIQSEAVLEAISTYSDHV